MEQGSGRIASVDYWERNTRWYQLWAEHGNYHEPILHQLMKHTQPHWRVLDIGAGNGVLSFPLAALGCHVTALEPCSAMRRLFFQEAWRCGIGHVAVDDRPWGDFSAGDCCRYDLILASNSLHVCGEGMIEAFRLMLAMRPQNIFVVTECGSELLSALANQGGYALQRTSHYTIQSPHVYHSVEEAYEHWRFRFGAGGNCLDKHAFASPLRLSEGHWYLDETANVSLLWWKDRE